MFQPKSHLLWKARPHPHHKYSKYSLSTMFNTEHTGRVKTHLPLASKISIFKNFFFSYFFYATYVFNTYISRDTRKLKNTHNTSRTCHSGTVHKSSDIKPETMTVNDTPLTDS